MFSSAKSNKSMLTVRRYNKPAPALVIFSLSAAGLSPSLSIFWYGDYDLETIVTISPLTYFRFAASSTTCNFYCSTFTCNHSFPRSLVVLPITKTVVSRKPSCQIKMNIDPKSALSAVVLVGTLVFVAVWKAIEIYSAAKSGSDAIETFSKFRYRFGKYRLEGYSVTKSLMSAYFEKDLKTDELIATLLVEVRGLNLQTQNVLEEVQKQNLQDQNVLEEFQKLSMQDQNVLEEFQKLNLQNENILVEVQSLKVLLQEAVASHKCKGKSGDCDYSMDSTED